MTPCCNLSDRFVTRPDPYSEGVTKATNIYEQSGSKEATWSVLWAEGGKIWQRVKRLDLESKAPPTDEPSGPAEPEVPEAGPGGQRRATAAAAKAATARAQKTGALQFRADFLSLAAEIKRVLKSGAGQTSSDAGDADADHAKKTSPG